MEELKTEVRYEIRSTEQFKDSHGNVDGEPWQRVKGPYRLLSHAKMGMRYTQYWTNPRIVKITRTFTEVEEVVDL